MSNVFLCLSSYACHPDCIRGRFAPEADDKFRSCFQRDRDRVVHSGAFRKLEYKTQVFINYEGDYYRTRLTHSLEVAQIARSLARRLGLNEDLTEAISLAHDLGHPPFGHAGEDGLKIAAQDYYEFDHNVQSLRTLIELEQRYARFDGMNLTWEMLEGIAKHNGPQIGRHCPTPTTNRVLLGYNNKYDLALNEFPSAEAQISSISDDIAYNSHDIDDGLRAQLLSVDDLLRIPLLGGILTDMLAKYPEVASSRSVHEALRKFMGIMIEDVATQFVDNIKSYDIHSVDDIRKLDCSIVRFSPGMEEVNVALRELLSRKVYRHYRVNRITSKAKRIVQELFNLFYHEPTSLPAEWSNLAISSDSNQRAIVICDFIAGMTDRFAVQEHRRIFDTSYEMNSF